VLKTHIDIISDFSQATIDGLTQLSNKHNFLIFEDRKFVDIGSIVQKQYKGGPLRIFDWAHIVNASVLAGEGIINALDEVIAQGPAPSERGILILAEMTSKGSLATGEYTRASVQIAQNYYQSVIGFVATRELSGYASGNGSEGGPRRDEDFVVFTTGVNMSSKGDALGQQYQTPTSAVQGGSDFLIAGRGIYAAPDPIAAVKAYREAGWNAYLTRINKSG
jgi:orotidine-5'-phosphate decarboxylase